MSMISFTNIYATRCSICGLPLSVRPIYYNKSVGNVCGRCVNANEVKFISDSFERHITYENATKYLLYPCPYQNLGCPFELTWKVALKHETTCHFKLVDILCPLFHEKYGEWCSWVDKKETLPEHIKECHKKYYFEILPQQMKFFQYSSQILFSKLNDSFLVITFDYKPNFHSYHFNLLSFMNPAECEQYFFEVYLLDDDGKKQNIFKGGNIQNYLMSSKSLPGHGLNIPISDFENSRSCFTVRFNIMKRNAIFQSQNILSSMKIQEVNMLSEILQSELKCIICTNFLSSPVYYCLEGHNTCIECTSEVGICPVCGIENLGGRNLSLEKVAAVMNIACINEQFGCSFKDTIVNVKVHQLNCFLNKRDCFIHECSWFGNTCELLEHLGDHKFAEVGRRYTYHLKKTDEYLLLHENQIFLINLGFENNESLSYSVLHFGGNEREFQYELELIDPFQDNNRLTLKGTCQPVTYSYDNSSICTLTVPIEMLNWFIKKYKCRFQLIINSLCN